MRILKRLVFLIQGRRSPPKRFDTLFFLAEAPPGQSGEKDGSEIVHTAWLGCREVLKHANTKQYNIVFATEMNVCWVSRFSACDEAIEAARHEQPYPVMADIDIRGDKVYVVIPEEAGYCMTEKEWT